MEWSRDMSAGHRQRGPQEGHSTMEERHEGRGNGEKRRFGESGENDGVMKGFKVVPMLCFIFGGWGPIWRQWMGEWDGWVV